MVGKKHLWQTAIAVAWLVSWAGVSHAQQEILAMPRVGGYASTPDNSIGAGGVGRPLVSPYMNLPMIDALNIPGGYQTLVQPFVEQGHVNNMQTGKIQHLQQQVSNVQTTVTQTSKMRPGQIIRDTGHITRTMNYSHYYPTAVLR